MSAHITKTPYLNGPIIPCMILGLGLFATGCVTPTAKSDLWPELQPPKDASTPAVQQGPAYTVEIVPKHGKTERIQIPYTAESHVQNALDQSRAVKKFRRMTIDVLRPGNDGSGRVAKMASQFNSTKRQVSMQTDYALYPGDMVRVTEDSSTILDDIVEKSLGLSR